MNILIRQSLIENKVIKDKNNTQFGETLEEFVWINNQIQSIILSKENIIPSVINLEISANKENMCKTLAYYLVNIFLLSTDEKLINSTTLECLSTGNQMNTRGISEMFSILKNNLVQIENEFNQLYIKNSINLQSFKDKISDPILLAANQNIEYILPTMSKIYKHLLYSDGLSLYESIIALQDLLIFITLFSTISTILVYFNFYWFNIRKNENTIVLFEKMILNSINY